MKRAEPGQPMVGPLGCPERGLCEIQHPSRLGNGNAVAAVRQVQQYVGYSRRITCELCPQQLRAQIVLV
jgi:hypothetical protein